MENKFGSRFVAALDVAGVAQGPGMDGFDRGAFQGGAESLEGSGLVTATGAFRIDFPEVLEAFDEGKGIERIT